MRRELQSTLAEARTLPPEELPSLIGELAEISATALARLATPSADVRHDELIDVNEAAKRLSCSRDYIYSNHRRFPFTRRQGRKLLFSSSGLDAYLRKSR